MEQKHRSSSSIFNPLVDAGGFLNASYSSEISRHPCANVYADMKAHYPSIPRYGFAVLVLTLPNRG